MSQLSPEIFLEAKKYLSPEADRLVSDVQIVLEDLEGHTDISDYSFIVAPLSKAYEGYLKSFFLKLRIIDQYTYDSDRFRVGKTLNPSLRYKRFSVFQRLAEVGEGGEELAEILWSAWKHGRNEIFHFFPNDLKNIDRDNAEERISLLLNAIIKSGEFLKRNQENIDLL